MTSRLDPRISRKLGQFVSCCSALSVGFGLWVLTGWMFHSQIVKSILPGQVAVKANAAACFILIGFAMWFLRKEQPSVASGWKLAAKIAATIASVVGLLSLLEFLWGWDLGIDQLLFTAGAEDIPGSVRPGLMSPITALSFLWLGPALLLLDVKNSLGRRSAQVLPAGAAIASLFGILDFVLDANTTHTHISPITALVLFLLSFGLMFARTQFGFGALVASATLGGTLTRRLFPATVVIPMIIGWLRWKGAESHLYSDWAVVTTMTVVATTLLASLTAWTALLIHRADDRQREMGEALHQGEQRYRCLVTATAQIVWTTNPQGEVVDDMPTWRAFTGQSLAEIRGWGWIDSLHPDDRERTMEIWASSVKNRTPYETEYRIRRLDGEYRSVSVRGVPVLSEGDALREWVGTCTDTTGRKAAEEALRTSEQRIRMLLDSTAEAIYGEDLDGNCTFCNPATARLLGYDGPADVLGKNMHALMHHSRSDGVPISVEDCPLTKAMRAGRNYHSDNLVLCRRDGTCFPAECWSHALLEEGKPNGAVVTFLDVAERRRAEDELRKASLYARSLLEASLDPLVTIRMANPMRPTRFDASSRMHSA